jgi:hypothetical protein
MRSDRVITAVRPNTLIGFQPSHVISMSDAKQITTAFGTLMLLGLVVAVSGLLGRQVQSFAVMGLVLMAIAFAVLSIGYVTVVLERICARRGRCEDKAMSIADDPPSVEVTETDADRLRLTLESMQRDEESCEQLYSRRRCSLEEVIRARSLRLQAEIKLIRHERRPKSWAEACAEYQGSQ